jgi:hypothetical protein
VKVKGRAPLACKTDKIDAWVLAELSRRELSQLTCSELPAAGCSSAWVPPSRGGGVFSRCPHVPQSDMLDAVPERACRPALP